MMENVFVTRERLLYSEPREQTVTFSMTTDWDRSDHFITREDCPTRREGRRISSRQWKRQNAKMRRRHRKVKLWLAEASRRVSERLEQEMSLVLYGGPAGGSFSDSVLTEDKLREMCGLPPKPAPPITRWEFYPVPIRPQHGLFAGASDT